jgi:hypothetical protein
MIDYDDDDDDKSNITKILSYYVVVSGLSGCTTFRHVIS